MSDERHPELHPTEQQHEDGWSPRDFLISRGWRPREKSYDAESGAAVYDGWYEHDFDDPVYGHWESLREALAMQLEREVRRLGGYERLAALVDEHGIDEDELVF